MCPISQVGSLGYFTGNDNEKKNTMAISTT